MPKCRIKLLVSILLLSLGLTACSISNRYSFNQGIQAFRVQNYRTAFIRLLPEAQRGQPEAQYAVGYMYYYGQGVTENREQALYWIRCAAKAGNRDAIEALRILDPK